MAIQPADLQAIGLRLIGEPEEAAVRCGVSRLYYAAYHSALTWHAILPAPGSVGVGPAVGVHSQLCAQLKNPARTLGTEQQTRSRRISYLLLSAHTRRVTADYALQTKMDKAEVATHQREVQSILELTSR